MRLTVKTGKVKVKADTKSLFKKGFFYRKLMKTLGKLLGNCLLINSTLKKRVPKFRGKGQR